jgi:CRISPR-associated protein Cmr5
MSRQRSLEQERAAQAWECVTQVNRKYRKEYSSLAKGAPADIQSNGLGQMLAFWQAKKASEHDALYQHVSAWVTKRIAPGVDLLEWIIKKASTADYRRATAEAMAFLAWIKRFAEAELEVADGVPNSEEKR